LPDDIAYVENALKKSIALPEQIFEQSSGVSGLSASVPGRFDVPAKPALCWNVLHVAQREPDLPWRNTGCQRLIRSAAADTRQHERAAEDPGIPRPELIVH